MNEIIIYVYGDGKAKKKVFKVEEGIKAWNGLNSFLLNNLVKVGKDVKEIKIEYR